MIRQPIVVLVGHVDHGKSTVLEKIKGISITVSEAGAITQSIRFYHVPLNTIQKVCGTLLQTIKLKVSLPGLLFIDTPGHEAFTTLRKRGGSLADIAILIIDINEGIKPQTIESIEILKNSRTPFVIALNKIDLLPGWQIKNKAATLLQKVEDQAQSVKDLLDRRLYELLGKLYKMDLKTERFDRVDDFTKQIAIVPISAKTGEGIPELLMVLTGLAQRYLEKTLEYDIKGPAKGTIMEIKEEIGIGLTLDTIIYDGTLKEGDKIVIGTLGKPIITKVKALFEPDKKKLRPVKSVSAAIGVKISAPCKGPDSVEGAIAGMPIRAVKKPGDLAKIKREIAQEVREMTLIIDKEGIVIKADTLGSIEALIALLKEKGIKIRSASIGDVSKKDIAEASSELNPLHKVVLGFNIKLTEPDTRDVKVVIDDVIYRVVDNFEAWLKKEEATLEAEQLKGLVRPCKIKILPGYVFRQSNPAVVGVEVLGGLLTTSLPVMKEKYLTDVKSIQHEGENIQKAEKGVQVAVSLPGLTVGRQIQEKDVLYSDIPEEDFRKLKVLKKYLNDDEVAVLKEIAEIKRKGKPMWGV